MPFRFPHIPYGFNYNYMHQPFYSLPRKSDIPRFTNNKNAVNTSNIDINKTSSEKSEQKKYSDIQDSEYFFELFGIKLYFDDVLIICILIFLYNEQVHDQELFLCLILLLISWFSHLRDCSFFATFSAILLLYCLHH